jgi:hypothetical protein
MWALRAIACTARLPAETASTGSLLDESHCHCHMFSFANHCHHCFSNHGILFV